MKKIILLAIFSLTLVMASYSQNIRLVPPVGHTAQITDVDISSDGRFIVSSSVDKTVIVWDYATGREIIKFAGTNFGAVSCEFSDEADKVYSAGWDGKVREWSLLKFDQTAVWDGFDNGINCLSVFPDVKKVAIIGNAGTLKILNTKDGSIDKEIAVSKSACYGLDVGSKGKIIATGDINGNLKIFNAKDLSLLHEIKANEYQIKSISISPDETILVTSAYDYKIKVFDVKTGKLLHEFSDEYQMWSSCDISYDNKKLAAVTLNGKLYEWNLESGELLFSMQTVSLMSTAVKYKPDGKEIVACGSSNEINVYKSIEGKLIKTFVGSTSPIESVDAVGEEFTLASAHWDSRVHIFNMFKCKMINTAFVNNSYLSQVCLLKTGKDAVIASMSPGINIFNYHNSDISNFLDNESGIYSMVFSKDESMFALSMHDSTVYVYSTIDKSLLSSYKHKGDVMDVCFSNDGKFLCSVSRDKSLIVYSVENKKVYREFKNLGSEAESVAISGDGNTVAAGLWTGEIVMIDIPTSKIVKTLKPHIWIVKDMEFSPINDYLCSASWDRTICMTDWVNSEPVAKYTGHTGSVISVDFSDDGLYVVSGGWDNQIKILDSRNLEEICCVIPVGEEDYLITTPELYYMGTPDAARKVSFAVGIQTYGFDQFDLQYNRPDKVLEILPFADKSMIPVYKKAYDKRLEKTGFNIDYFEKDINAPSIFIKNIDDIQLLTEKEYTQIEISAFDTIHFIDRYNVYVNGVAEYGSNGKNVRKSNVKTINVSEKVKLSQGLNKIEVSCINTAGVESLRNSVEVFYTPLEPEKNDIYVISMAVAEYQNAQYNLNYTVNDGREIVSVFNDMSSDYNIIIDSLFGINCTRANFVSLKEKLQNTNVDDIVIIHFSGHGLLDEDGDFYFATYDVNFTDPSQNGLEYDLIEGILDGIPARNKLVLIDACHSGELDVTISSENIADNTTPVDETAQSALAAKGVIMYNVPGDETGDQLENSYDIMTEYFADIRKGTGSVVISAATGTGFALEIGDLEHGIFTYVLVKGLRDMEADYSGDGMISVSEMREYIFTNVEKMSEGYQKPTARKDNLVNDFIIYK
ncbi:MAG TPA: caspase family protein [Bacteroidales bacterium]|nr:caspase family protein [Bacteroidales bacterium]